MDIRTGNRIKISEMEQPVIEMELENGTKVRSNAIQLSEIPVITAARMSRTKGKTVVVDTDMPECLGSIVRIKVYKQLRSSRSFLWSVYSRSSEEFICDALPERELGIGRFVLDQDIEIRSLSSKVYRIKAELPDGRWTAFTKLDAAPGYSAFSSCLLYVLYFLTKYCPLHNSDLLLKATIDSYGKFIGVELLGDEDEYLDEMCSSTCLPDVTCCDFMNLFRPSMPQIRSVQRIDWSSQGNFLVPSMGLQHI